MTTVPRRRKEDEKRSGRRLGRKEQGLGRKREQQGVSIWDVCWGGEKE